ncbi:MAG: tetratricopeptide repeat protein, partial [Nitrososphaeria archaeon]|nr:tetratricopeptide repeat protein [Nitrososphaeria archaeon]
YSQDWKGKGRLKGVVLGEDGEPVANATVIFTHVQLQSKINSTTNKKGEFLAAWIKGGLWNVDVQAEGYLPKKMSYKVSEIIQNPPMEIVLKKTEKTVVREELREAVKSLLHEGNELFEQKKYEEAAVKFKEILEKVPELYQINLNIGNCYYQLEEYDSALPFYQAVLEKEPENNDALLSLGNIYIEKGELEKGMELLDRLSEEDITSPITLYNIGTSLFNKGRQDAAVEYYERAISQDPEMADAYYQVGLCYLGLNRKEEAKERFLKYLELEPESEKIEQVKIFLEYLEKDN